MSPYDIDLDRNPANFQPLTPLSFLERAASIFPDRTAIIHGRLHRTYAAFYARARRLAGERLGTSEYEEFVSTGDADFAWSLPRDEWDAISLNSTSGTTGDPKGVVYHHRGASLLAVGNVLTGSMGKHCVYLWTLPMFHCNGWCFPWTISVVAGTHVCLRQVRARAMYAAIADYKVTHLCGPPLVLARLLDVSTGGEKPRPHAA